MNKFYFAAEEIRETEYDPFYNDENVKKCIEYLTNENVPHLKWGFVSKETDVVVEVMKCLIPEIEKLDIIDKKKENLQCNLQKQLYNMKKCNDDNLALGLVEIIYYNNL